MQVSESFSSCQGLKMEGEPKENDIRFNKSLQELKDLRFQLHFAADYCEMSFLRAEQKKAVFKDTKEYICRALVTVVDHLGTVTSNLDCLLSSSNQICDTELRIDCLNQKLVMCQEYVNKLALARLRWSAQSPRFHLRYVSPTSPGDEAMSGAFGETDGEDVAKDTKTHYEVEEDQSLISDTKNQRPYQCRSLETCEFLHRKWVPERASELPARGALLMAKGRNVPTFHFQSTHKLRNTRLHRKAVWRKGVVVFMRRSKQTV